MLVLTISKTIIVLFYLYSDKAVGHAGIVCRDRGIWCCPTPHASHPTIRNFAQDPWLEETRRGSGVRSLGHTWQESLVQRRRGVHMTRVIGFLCCGRTMHSSHSEKNGDQDDLVDPMSTGEFRGAAMRLPTLFSRSRLAMLRPHGILHKMIMFCWGMGRFIN
jgi:hypothetical protein